MEELLTSGLRQLGLDPAPEQAEQLAEYAARLLEKNKVMNLTAITEPRDVATLHFLDCAALLAYPGFRGQTLLDVGTGAGFPGLVLKILRPELRLTLLDGLDKRVRFLEDTAAALGLSGVTCLHGRAEEFALTSGGRENFDLVTSRAVADLRVLSELCLPCVRVGGLCLCMKSAGCGGELAAAGRAVSVLGGRELPCWDYAVPFTDVTHRLVPVEKIKPTPPGYPRRFGKIRKSPL